MKSAVQVAQRWIVAALRHRKFFSLEETNQAVRELLERLNHRPFHKREGSRASVFEALDKPALKPLPSESFDMSEWSRARVNIDYHIAFDANLYSVPYNLVHEIGRFAQLLQPSRFCTRARAWLRTCGAAAEGKPSQITSTGPRVTRLIWNGRHRAWCIGLRP